MKALENEKTQLLTENEVNCSSNGHLTKNQNSNNVSVSSGLSVTSKKNKTSKDISPKSSETLTLLAKPKQIMQTNQTHELAFFIQQQKDSNQNGALISPQLRLASFQILSSCKSFLVKPKNISFLLF